MSQNSFEEKLVISECKQLLKSLLTKYLLYEIPPIYIVHLSKALYAISNYPKKVIVGYLEITASARSEDEMNYYSIYISSTAITLSNGSSVYEEGVGSDSFSDLFYSNTESTSHDIEREIDYWFDNFNSILCNENGNLSIEDESDFLEEEELEEE